MPWLRFAYYVVAITVCLFAALTAWRSADQVIANNRGWTRGWRIIIAAFAAGPAGWLVPFGAVYVILRHRKAWLR